MLMLTMINFSNFDGKVDFLLVSSVVYYIYIYPGGVNPVFCVWIVERLLPSDISKLQLAS